MLESVCTHQVGLRLRAGSGSSRVRREVPGRQTPISRGSHDDRVDFLQHLKVCTWKVI